MAPISEGQLTLVVVPHYQGASLAAVRADVPIHRILLATVGEVLIATPIQALDDVFGCLRH